MRKTQKEKVDRFHFLLNRHCLCQLSKCETEDGGRKDCPEEDEMEKVVDGSENNNALIHISREPTIERNPLTIRQIE